MVGGEQPTDPSVGREIKVVEDGSDLFRPSTRLDARRLFPENRSPSEGNQVRVTIKRRFKKVGVGVGVFFETNES